MANFPVLSGSDRGFYPVDGRCPVCSNEFKQGFAYLMAGALLLAEDGQDSIHSDRQQAFLHIGFHGRDSEMRDSAGVTVVDHLHGGQFDLNWCSVKCMREWFLELLLKVENEAGNGIIPEL